MQDREYWCGPASIEIAIKTLGMSLSQSVIAEIAGTDKHGSDESNMERAFNSLGIHAHTLSTCLRPEARAWITGHILKAPLILCVDDWSHWIAITGICNGRAIVQDPGNSHAIPLAIGRLLDRIKASKKISRAGGQYFGYALYR